jgi:hypothetical protein
MPDVRLSISSDLEVALGSLFVAPFAVCSAALPLVGALVTAPFNGDFLRTGAAFDGSARGFAGALAFLTATGGKFSARELEEGSGREL